MTAFIRLVRSMRRLTPVLITTMVLCPAASNLCSAESKSGEDAAPAKPGFAIESEMLTYSALDSESAAVACGIAVNVGAADSNCTAHATTGNPAGVVVVSAGSSALSEFQLWRTDISTMDMLTLRANHYCAQSRGALSSLESLVSMIPEGQALQLATALLTTTVETNPVEGDILDQTLVNDISGHLRALGISVVIPDTYMPRSLLALDQAHSPFLTRFVALVKARACVAPAATEKEADKSLSGVTKSPSGEVCPPAAPKVGDLLAEQDKLSIASAIDAFLKSLNAAEIAPTPKSDDEKQPPPTPSITHLSAVLRADGLAQALETGSSEGASGNWYVLSLKALESGGTFMKSGNAILGTKTTYSGGAVGTYSFFRLNGNLECSGVFYNYSGPILTTAIPKMLQNAQPMPAGKMVGGCSFPQR